MVKTIPVTSPAPSAALPAALFGGLVAGLVALVIAFTAASDAADRQFDLARLAEQQAAAVGRIATLADANAGRGLLVAELRALTQLIHQEQMLARADDAARAGQELADVGTLHRLAPDPAGQGAFRRLVLAISQREGQEVAQARMRLLQLHRRAGLLAVLLALEVLACAAVGAWLLGRRNRTLAAEVTARSQQLDAVDASRRLFFAKTSHELRTPVQAMRSQAEIALSVPGDDAGALRGALEHVVAGAVTLGHRIDELLGLASADNGQLQLRREPIDLRGVVQAAASETASMARSVECVISLDLPDTPAPVMGDARWLRQALITVIDNGLKFSPMGGTLAVALRLDAAGAVVTVTDRGPGVVEAELPRIFDAFYQSEAGRSRGGNGLGLALARWVVEHHGGTIHAANLAPGGCCLTIALPQVATP